MSQFDEGLVHSRDNPLRRELYRKIVRITDRVAEECLTPEVGAFMRRIARAVTKGPYALNPDARPVDWALACIEVTILALSIRRSVMPERIAEEIADVMDRLDSTPSESELTMQWTLFSCGYLPDSQGSGLRISLVKKHARSARQSMEQLLAERNEGPGNFLELHPTNEESPDENEEGVMLVDPSPDGAEAKVLTLGGLPGKHVWDFSMCMTRWSDMKDHVQSLIHQMDPSGARNSAQYAEITELTDAFADGKLQDGTERMRTLAALLLSYLPDKAAEHDSAAWARLFRAIGMCESVESEAREPASLPIATLWEGIDETIRAWESYMDGLERVEPSCI